MHTVVLAETAVHVVVFRPPDSLEPSGNTVTGVWDLTVGPVYLNIRETPGDYKPSANNAVVYRINLVPPYAWESAVRDGSQDRPTYPGLTKGMVKAGGCIIPACMQPPMVVQIQETRRLVPLYIQAWVAAGRPPLREPGNGAIPPAQQGVWMLPKRVWEHSEAATIGAIVGRTLTFLVVGEAPIEVPSSETLFADFETMWEPTPAGAKLLAEAAREIAENQRREQPVPEDIGYAPPTDAQVAKIVNDARQRALAYNRNVLNQLQIDLSRQQTEARQEYLRLLQEETRRLDDEIVRADKQQPRTTTTVKTTSPFATNLVVIAGGGVALLLLTVLLLYLLWRR